MKKIIASALFVCSFLSAYAQFHATTDTLKGVALVVLEYTVADPGGTETKAFNLQVVYAYALRQPVNMNVTAHPDSPASVSAANATAWRYYTPEHIEIPTADVLTFKKRPWK